MGPKNSWNWRAYIVKLSLTICKVVYMQMSTFKSKRIIPPKLPWVLNGKRKSFHSPPASRTGAGQCLRRSNSWYPKAIDKIRSNVHDVQLAIMYGIFLKSEQQPDEAIQLYDKAAELHYNHFSRIWTNEHQPKIYRAADDRQALTAFDASEVKRSQ